MPAAHAIHVTTERYRILFGYPGVSEAEVDQSDAEDYQAVFPTISLSLSDYRERGFGTVQQISGPTTFEFNEPVLMAESKGGTVGYRDNLVFISPQARGFYLDISADSGFYRVPMRYSND